MAMINYADKVALNQNSNIADINKVKADDMNEIKTVVNENDTRLTTVETDIDNLNTYSTAEQVIGTWYDGCPIYQKTIVLGSLVDCVAETWTTVANISNLNIRTCINSNLISNNDWSWNGYLLRNNSGNLQVFNIGTTWAVLKIILEYTKTTD